MLVLRRWIRNGAGCNPSQHSKSRLAQLRTRAALTWFAGTAAGLLVAMDCDAQTAPSQADDAWHFAVTPYLWTAGLNGSTRIGPTTPINVDASFSDIANRLSAALMAAFEARRDRWLILSDLFYIRLSDTTGPLAGGALGTAKLRLDQTIVGLGGAYRWYRDEQSFVDIGLGVRYVNLDAHITFSQSPLLPNGLAHNESVNWADGIVLIRGSRDLSSRWAIYGYADLGTGGSKWSGQLLAGAQYKWSQLIRLDVGYRILAEDYDSSNFLYDTRIQGPFLGARIQF